MRQKMIQQAQSFWEAGQPLDAGRLIYEHVPDALRPAWAAKILAFAQSCVPLIPEITTILEIASDQDRWSEAYDAFQTIRSKTLQTKEPLHEGILVLAENVAKVIHNSNGKPPFFDHDAGWWIAQNLKDISELYNTPEFSEQAWEVLSAANIS